MSKNCNMISNQKSLKSNAELKKNYRLDPLTTEKMNTNFTSALGVLQLILISCNLMILKALQKKPKF